MSDVNKIKFSLEQEGEIVAEREVFFIDTQLTNEQVRELFQDMHREIALKGMFSSFDNAMNAMKVVE